MIAAAVRHHAAQIRPQFLLRFQHRVARAPRLERSRLLEVLALEVEPPAGDDVEGVARVDRRAVDEGRDARQHGTHLGRRWRGHGSSNCDVGSVCVRGRVDRTRTDAKAKANRASLMSPRARMNGSNYIYIGLLRTCG